MLDNKNINARMHEELFANFELEELIISDLVQCKTLAEFASFKEKYPADVVYKLCASKITSAHLTMLNFSHLKAIPAPSMFL